MIFNCLKSARVAIDTIEMAEQIDPRLSFKEPES